MDNESVTYKNLSTLKKIRYKLDISTGHECEDQSEEDIADKALIAIDTAIELLEGLCKDD